MTFSVRVHGNSKAELTDAVEKAVLFHPSTPKDKTVENMVAAALVPFSDGALEVSAHGHHEDAQNLGPLANVSVSVCRASHKPVVG